MIKRVQFTAITADGTQSRSLPPFNGFGSADLVFTGAGSTSIQLAGSNDGTNFVNIGSAITASTYGQALFASSVAWKHIRATASSTSGTISVQINVYLR